MISYCDIRKTDEILQELSPAAFNSLSNHFHIITICGLVTNIAVMTYPRSLFKHFKRFCEGFTFPWCPQPQIVKVYGISRVAQK